MREWPINGALIALATAGAMLGLTVWERRQAQPVAQHAPPAPPEIAFGVDRAFSEFHARTLGLPVVQNYRLQTNESVQK